LKVVALDIQNIQLARANESLHPWMVFHCVNDGMGNSINRMKDWHESMLKHIDIPRKKDC
jgi:hypothetical protein